MGDLAVSRRGTMASLNQQEEIEVQQERLNLNVPKPLFDSLKTLSEKDGRPVPELARAALADYVERKSS